MEGSSMKRAAEAWFRRARADLKAARREAEDAETYVVACFLSHQVAEKYLKGFLLAHGRSVVRTHDLQRLVQECSRIDADFQTLFQEAAHLNPYYIGARYPTGEDLELEEQDVTGAIGTAERIARFVESRVAG